MWNEFTLLCKWYPELFCLATLKLHQSWKDPSPFLPAQPLESPVLVSLFTSLMAVVPHEWTSFSTVCIHHILCIRLSIHALLSCFHSEPLRTVVLEHRCTSTSFSVLWGVYPAEGVLVVCVEDWMVVFQPPVTCGSPNSPATMLEHRVFRREFGEVIKVGILIWPHRTQLHCHPDLGFQPLAFLLLQTPRLWHQLPQPVLTDTAGSSLNSGPWGSQAGTLPLEPCPQCFLFWLFFNRVMHLCRTRLWSSCLYFLSSWDDRCRPLHPAFLVEMGSR